MAQFIITYFAGDKPSSPEEGKAHFEEYQKWLASLGESAVKPMVPFKNNHTIQPNGEVVAHSIHEMSGHTVVEAESIEQALEFAKSCPFLKINGTLEVSEIVQM